MSRIVIVGGGISGLALAWQLQQRLPTAAITLLEATTRAGGQVWSQEKQGFRIELGANGFLDNKPGALRLCRELGISGELIAANPEANKRFLFLHDDLAPLPGSLSALLASPLLSLKSKWRLASERYRKRGRETRDESVFDFIARRTTPEVAELLGDALVTGIFAGDARKLSLAASFPRLFQAEREFGSVTRGLPKLNRLARAELTDPGEPLPRKTRLWSFKAGLGALVTAISARLKTAPLLGVPVRALQLQTAESQSIWRVQAEGKDAFEADVVVLTCPAAKQAALVADLDENLADQLLHIPYASVAVVSVGYRAEEILRPIVGYGYLAPLISRRELLGVQYCSNIWHQRAPDGCVLLRAMCGGWHRPEVMSWDDDKLSIVVRQELRLTLGILGRPRMLSITRWDPAIPQYTLGHLERIHGIETQAGRHPGLFLGGNAYRGISINDCIEDADYLANRVVDYLRSKPER